MIDGRGDPVTPAELRRLLHTAGWLTAAIVVLLVLEQLEPVRDAVWSIDGWFHRRAVAAEGRVGLALAGALSVLGGVYVTAPLRVLIAVWFAVTRRWWWLAAWVLSTVVAEVVVTAMKDGFDRPRPPGALEATRQAAFPSGHAAATTVMVVTLLLLVAPTRRAWWWLAGGAVVATMGASRVYLRVHWPSDVAMGSLVGGAAAVLAVGSVALLADRRARPRGVRLRGRNVRRNRS